VRGDVHIEAADRLDAADCRRLVLASEPWMTLGYGEPEVQGIVRAASTDHLLLARTGDHVVGFALSAPGVLLGEYLKILAVDAAYRATGVGRALMAELERRAFQRWPNIYLCVSDFNPGGRAFYRRLGYEEVGPLHDLLLPGTGEILMRKTIAAWRAFRPTPA
jgi:[ribosomal protein S18]-alanine N-acetyltransferase